MSYIIILVLVIVFILLPILYWKYLKVAVQTDSYNQRKVIAHLVWMGVPTIGSSVLLQPIYEFLNISKPIYLELLPWAGYILLLYTCIKIMGKESKNQSSKIFSFSIFTFIYGSNNKITESNVINNEVSEKKYLQNIEQMIAIENDKKELENLNTHISKQLKRVSKNNEKMKLDKLIRKIRFSSNFNQAWSAYIDYLDLNLTLNLYIYILLVFQSDSYLDVSRVLIEIKKMQIKPNEFLASSVIKRTENYVDALNIYTDFKAQGVIDNEYIFFALINKTEKQSQTIKIFEEANAKNLLNEYVLWSTLNKIKSYEKSIDIFILAKSNGVKMNNFIYSTLINKAESFSDALDFFKNNIKKSFQPNNHVYSALVSKAKSKVEIDLFLTVTGYHNISANKHVFESFIRNSTNYDEAFEYYEKMLLLGQKPDKYIFTALISKVESLDKALEILSLMVENSIEIDSYVFLAIMKKAVKPEDIKNIFSKAFELSVNLESHVYTEAIKRSTDEQQANEIYRLALMKNISIDAFFYTCLLSKVLNFDEAKSIYKDSVINEVYDDCIISTLLSKATQVDEVEWVLSNTLKHNGTNKINFPFRFSSIRGGINCISNLINAGYNPDYRVLSKLFSSNIDDDLTAQEVLEFIWSNNLPIEPLNALIKQFSKVNIAESLRLLLHYPHLTSGIPLYKKRKTECENYLSSYLHDDNYMNDSLYALSMFHYINKECIQALEFLNNIPIDVIENYPEQKRKNINDLKRNCKEP